ncbi:hypothetical protein LNQ52_14710 [Klebsiella pneumoniae subsp. pneumoniae]|nr:hypothetical protein [Klebsiella pneumoniae subsp. pneumoniae]
MCSVSRRGANAQAAKAAGIQLSDISLIRINEATPVIGDVAMETITETIITGVHHDRP